MYHGAVSVVETAIDSFTHPGIGGAVAAAAKKGVRDRVLTNSDQLASYSIDKDLIAGLQMAGAIVWVDTHTGLIHLKMCAIDRKVVTGGSYNYSNSSSNNNDEVLLVIRDPSAVKECLAEFNRMWDASKGNRDYKP
jgi:phosphatidylserine/phosphatidylglycerophosphate/cardiolipin synthase-like enzyme